MSKPPRNWGVAWFGDREPKSGTCARCQEAGRVYKAYNGGQYLFFDVCVPCQPKVLADQRAYLEGRR